MSDNIAVLIERTRDGDISAARELADTVEAALQTPERRIGAALQPKGRGGEPEWLADQRAARDSGYRDLARAEYGTVFLTPRQAKLLARKVTRAVGDSHLIETGNDLRRDALRRIRASELDPLGERQLLRILPKKL
jgi:hypothetical protein